MEIRILESIGEITSAEWEAIAGGQPPLRHAFLGALEDAGCVSRDTGWIPLFPTLWREEKLVGAMPLYLKQHSWGEYVFDWAWADAYRRHGLAYYPKLACCVPFTPVPGPRLLAANPDDRAMLLGAALELASKVGASSLHCLFPEEPGAAEMAGQGMMIRRGIQFHWENRGYADFEDYLCAMNHDKRKRIRQERRKVRDAGISFERKVGRAITEGDWAFFESCYRNTYRAHHSSPYLNLDFFLRIGTGMPENLLMVLAFREGRAIASALNFFDKDRLYGRYWGALEQFPGLHFETCYYQGLEFCIERKLSVFEGGAQGEHKLARGFLPVKTWSAHWLAHAGFSRAVDEFLALESEGISMHLSELNEAAPFRRS